MLQLTTLLLLASTAGNFTVTTNPTLCDPSVRQIAGYFSLDDGKLSKNYFFWFFESRSAPATDPLVLWMTGGPGCSSEVALFGENGPCSVNADGSDTVLNKNSWNSKANLLYIDQPAGTGFSYGAGMDHNEEEVADDMYNFITKFMEAYHEYAELKFFTFGESYAGHYVPAVTHKIWSMNQKSPKTRINLKGTAVGNGLTDPSVQYRFYPDMIISTNHHNAAVNNATYKLMKAAVPVCVAGIAACQKDAAACVEATDVCNLGLIEPYQLTGMNPYDMRVKCAVPPLCYNFSNVAKYLERDDVRKQLGVTRKWSDCNRAVDLAFVLSGDWMQNYQQMIPDQLASDIRVLLYAGDQDYICNWLGNQAWTLALDWPHKAAFNAATPKDWTVNGSPAGKLRSSNGLSFLQVFEAGHMVPRDQPENALAMLNAFITGSL